MSAAPAHNDPDYGALLDTARRLTEPVAGMAGQLRDLLDADTGIRAFDTSPSPGEVPGCAFIDGAVAHEQTDALAWVCAVGARLNGRAAPTVTEAAAVAPVSGDVERLRSALMACCELAAATTPGPTESGTRAVFMDGGLATPLISIAQGLLVRDADVDRAVREHYAAVDLPALVGRYVDLIEQGRVVALPKQDTATGFTSQWADTYSGRFEHPDTHLVLARMRDRPLAGSLLAPGEFLTPRPAHELARTEIKQSTHDGAPPDALTAALAPQYRRLAAMDRLHVTYLKPRRLPTRVVKIEYRETAPSQWSTAATLSSLIDGVTMGPRVKEPLPQYQVDTAAKKAVTTALTKIMAVATLALDDSSATSHYRT